MKSLLTALAIVLGVAACDSGSSPAPANTGAPNKPAKPAKSKATATTAATAAAAEPGKPIPAELLDPSLSKDKAPDKFRVTFTTTKGDFVIEVVREWAPHGADRFYNLVKSGFFEDVALFRAVKNFMVQFGIHGDPRVAQKWKSANIPGDEPKQSNTRGMLTYAMAGRPDTRSTQLFINYKDNSRLDEQGFAPIGKVVEGMDIVDSFYQGYGEATTKKQGNIVLQGNSYLRQNYPKLDYIKSAKIVGDGVAEVEVGADGVKAGDVEVNKNGVKAGGTQVDSKGGVKAGGVEVDSKGGVKAGGVEVDSAGNVKVPGM